MRASHGKMPRPESAALERQRIVSNMEFYKQAADLAAGLAGQARRAARRGRRRIRVSTDSEAAETAPGPPRGEPEAGEKKTARAPRATAQAPERLSVRGSAATPAPSAERPRASKPTARLGDDVKAKALSIASAAGQAKDLGRLREQVARCTACDLCRTRTQTVFSDGDGSAGVMFVGEAPGQNEDEQGVPFVGRAGALLTDIIEKGMGLERPKVYIANVLKCRPPDNREPAPHEKALCTGFLARQIELVAPRVIVPLGRHAANQLLGTDASMGALRGRVHERDGRRIVPTFHPAYLLRSPSEKKECWKDIQVAMGELGLGPRRA